MLLTVVVYHVSLTAIAISKDPNPMAMTIGSSMASAKIAEAKLLVIIFFGVPVVVLLFLL